MDWLPVVFNTLIPVVIGVASTLFTLKVRVNGLVDDVKEIRNSFIELNKNLTDLRESMHVVDKRVTVVESKCQACKDQ